MPRVFALSALLLFGAGADPSRWATPPPSPAPQSPADSVLFRDTFSDGLSRWHPDRDSTWSVWRGVLRVDLPDRRQERSLIYAGSPDWRDYALDFDVCMMRGVDKGGVVRVLGENGIGIDLRGGGYQDVVAYAREWPLGKAAALNANGAWNHVRIEVKGDRLRVWVNGELGINRTQTRAPRGHIALAAYTGGAGQCTAYFDNVLVTRR
jgi:hypothetical protein